MAVGVHHGRQGTGQLLEIGAQLIGQAMAGAGVDDDQARLATDDADRLVQRRVAADPDAIPDLAPDARHAPRRTAVPEAVTISIDPWPTVS